MWEKGWATAEQEMLPSGSEQLNKCNTWAHAVFQVIRECNSPQMRYHKNEEQLIIDHLSHETMRLAL